MLTLVLFNWDLIHPEIQSSDASWWSFPYVTKRCLLSLLTRLPFLLTYSSIQFRTQSFGFILNLWEIIVFNGLSSLVCLSTFSSFQIVLSILNESTVYHQWHTEFLSKICYIKVRMSYFLFIKLQDLMNIPYFTILWHICVFVKSTLHETVIIGWWGRVLYPRIVTIK